MSNDCVGLALVIIICRAFYIALDLLYIILRLSNGFSKCVTHDYCCLATEMAYNVCIRIVGVH